MRTARSRVLAANRERIWAVAGDPYHEPRWWPRVTRVEGVGKRGWTSVMTSSRGNAVRADWTLEESRAPELRRWRQEVAGTAFERVLVHNVVELQLERVDGGTEVTLAIDQQLRGLGRVVPGLARRPVRRLIDAALDGLAEAVGAPGA
jgi:uncharacterized protein YndB with AHSA1/START domain